MQLHLIRHGQTHWNAQRRIQGQLESELDELGLSQARERGKDFLHMPLQAAYCSSSIRTRQTIDNMLPEYPHPIVYMDALREVHLGIWQGRMWSEVEASHPDMVVAYNQALPHFYVEGAETSAQAQQRGIQAVEDIIMRHKHILNQPNILIVSHGAIMKKILGFYVGIELTELHKLPPLPNCAHCIVDVDGDSRRVSMIAGEPIESTAWCS